MMEFIDTHENLLFGLTLVSIMSFIASILLIPWIVTQIPADYFTHPKRQRYLCCQKPKMVRFMFIFLKNIIGVLLIIGGIFLLFLPGQGILTILIGLLIIDFPYKYRFEIWVIKHPFVLKSVNKLRTKTKKRPLVI